MSVYVYYLLISIIIFSAGLLGILLRRNLLMMLLSFILALNGLNLLFVSGSFFLAAEEGEAFVFFVFSVLVVYVVAFFTLGFQKNSSEMKRKLDCSGKLKQS